MRRLSLGVLLIALIGLGLLSDSAPEMIGGVLAVVVFLVTTYAWRHWVHARALNLLCSVDAYRYGEDRVRRVSTEFPLQLGESAVLLRICPNRGCDFERVGVRFVERRWLWKTGRVLSRITQKGNDDRRNWLWKWDNANREAIRIKKMEDTELVSSAKETKRVLTDWNDEVGGRWGEYNPPYFRALEDSLWVTITVEVKKPWRGHLSFQGSVDGNRRAYSRRTAYAPVTN